MSQHMSIWQTVLDGPIGTYTHVLVRPQFHKETVTAMRVPWHRIEEVRIRNNGTLTYRSYRNGVRVLDEAQVEAISGCRYRSIMCDICLISS